MLQKARRRPSDCGHMFGMPALAESSVDGFGLAEPMGVEQATMGFFEARGILGKVCFSVRKRLAVHCEGEPTL